MTLKNYIAFTITALLLTFTLTTHAEVDKSNPEYLALRDSLTRTFNDDDSVGFFRAVANLEEYCLAHDDLHIYYTQRCNEIVFLLNRQNVFEAYKLAMKLSRELRERKLDKEYYMAINMMGHIYNYCGNTDMARNCFQEVLERMEEENYRESMPPIYMNLVQVVIDKDPEEAMRLLDKAEEVATTPDRLLGIDSYRTIYAFKQGDMKAFQEGYQRYVDARKQGLTSVHGHTLDTYYLMSQGDYEGAIRKSFERDNGAERYALQAYIYERAGNWRKAYEALKQEKVLSDSLNTVILSNSMQGIQNELKLFEAEQSISKQRFLTLIVVAVFLTILVIALFVYSFVRRRHVKELRQARDRALESDRMKSAFISNISHEIRTPLNIIGGFMQVMADPSMELGQEERNHITSMVLNNTNLITSLVDEMLELSLNDVNKAAEKKDVISPNVIARQAINGIHRTISDGVQVSFETTVDDEYQIQTNHVMLRKILNALLDNAVKCTEKGRIVLSFRQLASTFCFVVEDTGIGVPASAADRIFERFEKLDDFKDGLGLGLPLARALAQRMGGDVKLDTTYTAGARFVLELPLP